MDKIYQRAVVTVVVVAGRGSHHGIPEVIGPARE